MDSSSGNTKPVEKALVRYSYAAENEDELNLSEGDIITILDKELEDSGWWKGEVNGKSGVFPDNFVELMKEELVSEKAPMPVLAPTPQPKPKKPPPPSQPPTTAKPVPKLPDKAPVTEPKAEPPRDEKPPPMQVPGRKLTHPPPPLTKKPTKPTIDTPPVKEEEKPKPEVSAGSFEAVETTSDKLTHLTASRPRGPPKRPPSQVFIQNPKSSDKHIAVKEEERNGDIKDSHWLKDTKPTSNVPHPVSEKKEEVHIREKPHTTAPARPPEPTAAHVPASVLAAIEELKKELHHLKTNTVSKAQFNELKAENESLKKEIETVKSNNSRRLKDIMSEVDEEKKIRLSTQVEIERIRKLVAESHV